LAPDAPAEGIRMNSLARVALRELQRLPRFPVLWALLGPIPLAAGLLLTGVFNSEVARRLPIGVLDFDGSETARLAARWVNAARTVNIVARLQDLGQAQDLLAQRKVYAVLVIPRHFERDVLRGRSPGVTLLYNEQYLTAGNLISADVSRALSAGSVTGPPVRVDARLLFNPAINYARGVCVFLIVCIVVIFAVVYTLFVV
jgi:ABC-2 type transport system permease protein